MLAELIALFQPKVLAGQRIVITAGPTSEKIDPVRVITNRSSGKTGYAIARAAHEAGADVILISGPSALSTPYGVTRINVESASEMHATVMGAVRQAQIFISVAAVADWRVDNASPNKLKKNADTQAPQLKFARNPDILAEVARLEGGPWCVGFAAETENLYEYAEDKRVRKGVPLMVGNLAQQSMDSDITELILFDAHGHSALPALPKLQAARLLIQAISSRLPQIHTRDT